MTHYYLPQLLTIHVNVTQNEGHGQLCTSQSKGNHQLEPTRFNPQSADCKFNLVIYGNIESLSGTKWCNRAKHNMDSSVTTLAKINDSINFILITDCFRTGKYKLNQSHPQPILLKLNCAMDVATVLSTWEKMEPFFQPNKKCTYQLQATVWNSIQHIFNTSSHLRILQRPWHYLFSRHVLGSSL